MMRRTQNNIAMALAQKTADAYSFDRYRSWNEVARALLARGYREREVEAIMRSKWTRWAGDCWKGGTNENVPAKAVIAYIDNLIAQKGAERVQREVDQLVAETFSDELTDAQAAEYITVFPPCELLSKRTVGRSK
jgi:hypothetical protein